MVCAKLNLKKTISKKVQVCEWKQKHDFKFKRKKKLSVDPTALSGPKPFSVSEMTLSTSTMQTQQR